MDLTGWMHANALRGYTPRQRRLLLLEAIYEGTQYEHLKPWKPEVDKDGKSVPRCERAPSVRLGLAKSKVDRVHDLLVGQGRFPTLAGASEGLAKLVLETLNAEESVALPVFDLLVKGSGAIAVHKHGGRFVPVYLDTTFSEPIFASQAGTERARLVAEEMEQLEVSLPAPAAGEYLFVPEGSDPDEVIFVRHQFPFDDEVAGVHHAGDIQGVRWMRRRDYFPTVTLEYEDIRLGRDTVRVGAWKLDERPRPHNWGVVPVAWARSPRARPDVPDGPSFLTPHLISLDEAADYAASRKDDSVDAIAWPQEYGIDVQDADFAALDEAGRKDHNVGSSLAIRSFESTGQHQGQVGVFEISGSGPKSAEEHISDLSRHAERVSGVLGHDPERVKGALSGTAMERMEAPTVSTVNAWRRSVASLIYRLAYKAAKISGEAEPAGLTVAWGDIFAATAEDITAWAGALTSASGGPVMSRETAVMRFAAVAGIEDPESEVKRMESDLEDALARARSIASARTPPPPGDEGGGESAGDDDEDAGDDEAA